MIIGTYTDELKHFLVGYGYQNMVREDGVDYEGYIVHFGWGSTGNNAWINSRWCNSYIRLTMQHTHNHNIDTGRTINHTHRELNCSECGYRTVDNLYNTNSAGTEIKGLRYSISGSITIPSQINGITITAIGAYTFSSNISFNEVVLPNTVTSIGNNAFSYCSGLQSIILSDSVTSIGSNAFSYCSGLQSIIIPNSVTSIGNYAFLRL